MLLEGELEVLDGESPFTAQAGSVFHIPKGTLHAWRNATTRLDRTLLFITSEGFEGCFEEAEAFFWERSLLPATASDTRGLTENAADRTEVRY